jgi:hypothetical protein
MLTYPYLKDYKEHPEARVNPALFWEYDLSRFDYGEMKDIVVQRVVERGWPEDWHAILNMYGEAAVIESIKNIAYLSEKDMDFVSKAFNIPLSDLRCYERKQLHRGHWNS